MHDAAARHSLLQPPGSKTGGEKQDSKSFQAAFGLPRCQRCQRHAAEAFGCCANTPTTISTLTPISEMARASVQDDSLWDPCWSNLRPFRSMCFIDHGFHRTAGVSNNTGGGERHALRAGECRSPIEPNSNAKSADQPALRRRSLLLYKTALSMVDSAPAAPQSRRQRADGPPLSVRRSKPPTVTLKATQARVHNPTIEGSWLSVSKVKAKQANSKILAIPAQTYIIRYATLNHSKASSSLAPSNGQYESRQQSCLHVRADSKTALTRTHLSETLCHPWPLYSIWSLGVMTLLKQ